MNVYDQAQRAEMIVDPNYCTGCAVANVYQAMTGRTGSFARGLYERAKRSGDWDDARKPGAYLEQVCATANQMWGGEHHRLHTFEQVAAWLDMIGPIAVGLHWTIGMQHPTGRGGPIRRLFGPRWMDATPPTIGHHAVTILGGSARRQFFWIENSHGLSWGNKGVARMAWGDMIALLAINKARCFGLTFGAAGS